MSARGQVTQDIGPCIMTAYRYRASKFDCDPCPLKSRCCPKTPQRKIPRDIDEDARDVARALDDTPAFEQSRHERKHVEMLFAHLKRILKLGRLGCAGPVAHRTSSCSPPLPRTSGNSPSSDQNHHPSFSQHEEKPI